MAILGSSTITGDLAVTGNITGTFNGTATNALNATNATSATTATKWANSVNVTIKDNTEAHTGNSIAINGDANSLTLKLPNTIEATLTGKAAALNIVAAVGSTTKPVYFKADGTPAAISYTIAKSVPSDAVFADTKNTVGATNSTNTKLLIVGVSGSADTYKQSYINSGVYITTSNGIYAASYTASSDVRLKENIKDWAPKKSILDLPIKEFDFKDSKSHHIGCLAQDLREICPEIVYEDENGYLGIEESKLAYLLLDEIKKLKAEVLELKQKK